MRWTELTGFLNVSSRRMEDCSLVYRNRRSKLPSSLCHTWAVSQCSWWRSPPCGLSVHSVSQNHSSIIIGPQQVQNVPLQQPETGWRCLPIQGANPVYAEDKNVLRWAPATLWMDGWKEWEGTSREESVEFHWEMRWLPLFLTGPSSHSKKKKKKPKRHSQL